MLLEPEPVDVAVKIVQIESKSLHAGACALAALAPCLEAGPKLLAVLSYRVRHPMVVRWIQESRILQCCR